MSDIFYKPLPDFLELKKSKIHGLGLFTNKDLDKDYILGISHVEDKRFENGYIRTPLGGFYNHSDDPNIVKVQRDSRMFICALREIKPGEELTCSYTLYELKKL